MLLNVIYFVEMLKKIIDSHCKLNYKIFLKKEIRCCVVKNLELGSFIETQFFFSFTYIFVDYNLHIYFLQ